MKTPPIILASNSPRRKSLLRQIDLEFTVIPSSVHEDFTINLKPEEFASHYARLKASDLANQYPDHLVIGADTIVVLDDKILGKPRDEKESYSMLSQLSGRTHRVITGVSLQFKDKGIENTFHETTLVTFKDLSEKEKRYYIDNYQPFDKAGSYGIQDWFATCVIKVQGCFYNVVGFPISAFHNHFQSIFNND